MPDVSFQGLSVLITGGLGFIGSTLARRLVQLGARVTVVDSLLPQYGGNLTNVLGLEDCVRINISDIRDEHSIRTLVRGRNLIFNLAGQSSHADSMRDPFTDLDINCRAQLHVLEACREENPGVKLVYAGTRQIYGRPRSLPVDESHPPDPVDINGIHKLAGEWYHLLYHRVHGIRSCSLRLTNTYGPRMRIRDARQTFVGVWIRAVLEGRPFEVWDGDQLRDFTYVDDAVDALLLAATCPEMEGRALNLGGCPPVSLRELAEILAEIHGGAEFRIVPFPEEARRIDVGSYYADDRRFRKLTGWEPRVPLREGLARTLSYYRQHLGAYL